MRTQRSVMRGFVPVACLAAAIAVMIGWPAAGAPPEPSARAASSAPPAPAVAGTPAPGSPAPAAGQPAPAEVLAGLAFMAGCWEGEQGGVRSEECWLAPANGLMLGMHRDLFPNGKAFFEFLRVEAGPEGLVYLASPRGAPVTPFPLASIAPGRVTFANLQHDYPQRIIYEAVGRDRLKARVEGPAGGATKHEEWTWTRRW